jgi:Fe-S cluster assembly ATPase SufC
VILGCEGYTPTGGEILFEGRSINALRLYERAQLGITLCWQEPARLEGISVADYVNLGKASIDTAACLRRVGLAPEQYLQRYIDKTLSGGQRKRIELASVFALRPKLALLDEPDSGIDLLSLGEIEELIQSFKEAGRLGAFDHPSRGDRAHRRPRFAAMRRQDRSHRHTRGGCHTLQVAAMHGLRRSGMSSCLS